MVEIQQNDAQHRPQSVIINGKIAKYRKLSSRWVFSTDEFFLKLDVPIEIAKKGGLPKYHSKVELMIWKKYKDTELGQYLCPIVETGVNKFGQTWVLMPRCKQSKKIDSTMLSQKAAKMGLCDILPDQYHNVGYYKGQPVLLDFGV